MKINEDTVPCNLEECLKQLTSTLTTEDVKFINTHEPVDLHFSYGRFLRNSWSLWEKDTPLVNYFTNTYGVCHADDISGIILESLWAAVKGIKNFSPETIAEGYRQHWAMFGIDPKTGLQIK